MVICAVSLTACFLFHGPCMTSVLCDGALRALQGPWEPPPEPRLLFLVLVGWAGWRLRRQKEEQPTLAASGTCKDNQLLPHLPVSLWRHAICAIWSLHDIHRTHILEVCLDHSAHPSHCSELFHQQHTPHHS